MTAPKECTACGCADDNPDDPLVLWVYARTGVVMGWVHQGCADDMFKLQAKYLGTPLGTFELMFQQ